MNVNPVANCTLIIRSQAEYSTATQTVLVRCILESPVTGQRQDFTDLTALLMAIQTELTAMQKRILPLEKDKG